jgi:ParB-like chromosome segregation protein Spo0J
MAKKSVLTEAKDTVVTSAGKVETFARELATAAIVAASDAVAGALASRTKPRRPASKSRTKQAAKKRPVAKAKRKAVKKKTAKKKAAKKKTARKSARKKAAPKRARR